MAGLERIQRGLEAKMVPPTPTSHLKLGTRFCLHRRLDVSYSTSGMGFMLSHTPVVSRIWKAVGFCPKKGDPTCSSYHTGKRNKPGLCVGRSENEGRALSTLAQ